MNPDPNSSSTLPTFAIIAIVVLIILLILSAFFSMSETAFTSFNKIRMENLAKKSRSARAVLKISKNYDRLLSTILIGNNIVNITASAIATVLFTKYYGDIGPTISTIVVTIVILILGEVTPKSLAKERPEFFSRVNVFLLYFFYFLFFPISLLLSGIQALIKKMFKVKNDDPVYTEEEFSMLVEDMNEDGVLNDIEENIIQNTIEYGDTKVEEIMTPAKEVYFVKKNDSFEIICQKFLESNKSRMLVCKGKKLDSAYGVIHQKDLFELIVKNDKDISKIIMKDIIITKPTNKISRLLKKMQSNHQHMAIVKDDEQVVGICTMEDILEELVGEIKDENDED